MNDTYGRNFDASSPSASLQSSLESRLRARLDVNGSLEYVLTWKHWAMSSGPQICALRARARPTSGRGSTGEPSERTTLNGWPTPTVMDTVERKQALRPSRIATGRTTGYLSEAVVLLQGWHTPTVKDAANRAYTLDSGDTEKKRLTTTGLLRGWPSPKESNTTGAGQSGEGGPNLQTVASMAPPLTGWATSAARDWRSESATDEFNQRRWEHSRGKPLSAQVVIATEAEANAAIPGATSTSSSSGTAASVVLAPEFSRWLCGYPQRWDDALILNKKL